MYGGNHIGICSVLVARLTGGRDSRGVIKADDAQTKESNYLIVTNTTARRTIPSGEPKIGGL